MSEHDSWQVERREDGVIVVRVPSRTADDPPLPDAVFAFRVGDPQYEYWSRLAQERAHA